MRTVESPHDPETVVSFTVHGTPIPQGSKTVAHGGGRSWVREDNRKIEPWRNDVAAAAVVAMRGRLPIAGAARLEATFAFDRPRSHFRTGRHAGQLRPGAPVYCDRRPDLDKLLRAIGDALSGIVVADDARLVEVAAAKVYGAPAAYIVVLELV